MKKILCGLIVVVFVAFSFTGAYANDYEEMFSNKRTAVLYVDLVRPYSEAVQTLKEIDNPEHESLKSNMDNFFNIALGNFFTARHNARQRACMANQRVILGAVEMYNMDNREMIEDNLDFNLLTQEDLPYLRSVPECPDGGEYYADGNLATAEGQIKCTIHGSVDDALMLTADEVDAESFPISSLEYLIERLLDFHNKALFRPVGGIYLAIDDEMGFGVLVQAQIKPFELFELLSEELGAPRPEDDEKTEKGYIFRETHPIDPSSEVIFNITETGIFINGFLSESASNLEAWQPLKRAAQRDSNHLVLEILPKNYHDLIPIFQHANEPELQEIIKRLITINSLRLILADESCALMASSDDAEARDFIKGILTMFVSQFKAEVLSQADEQREQLDDMSLKIFNESMEMISNIEVVERGGQWVGINTSGIPQSSLILPGLGIISAIAIPNFSRARSDAREKACFANKRVLLGATEMYNMDNPAPLSGENKIQTLFQNRYLRSAPECPDGGTYSITNLGDYEYRIECSVHGHFQY